MRLSRQEHCPLIVDYEAGKHGTTFYFLRRAPQPWGIALTPSRAIAGARHAPDPLLQVLSSMSGTNRTGRGCHRD